MDETKALNIARRRYGDCVTSVTIAGDCVISVKENGHYIPMGYGRSWQEALLDCACRHAFAEDYSYA